VNISTWLFLYLTGLMELDIRYRLTTIHWQSTLVIMIPLLALAAARPLSRGWRWLGAALSLACSICMARELSLDFWDTQRLDLALLSAGIGLGGLLTVREECTYPGWNIVNWLTIAAGWALALWHPLGPWIAMGPAASLALWRRPESPVVKIGGLSPAWLLFWIGMAISKPWWDTDDWGEWIVALWALGVTASYLPKVRELRLPWPLAVIALLPLLYPWIPYWVWAPLLGLVSGYALQHSARPWHHLAGYALLAGMLLSYTMHSNLELFGPLVWGSR
jgi:hypothetical protein